MTKKVLVADKIAPEGVDYLKSQPGLEVEIQTGLDEAGLCEAVKGCAGLIVRSAAKVTPKVLGAGKDLEVIGRAGIGVDNIDVVGATERGVVVLNTPDANATTTAELTIAHLLSMSRNLPQADGSVRSGGWERSALMGVEVSGKTLGVIGFGTIGRLVATRAKALGMTVMVHDPFVTAEVVREAGATTEVLSDLLAAADYVTLHCPVNDHTRGIINAQNLAAMKSGARLINCARGALVDESALAQSLSSGHLAGAALDVFATEPPTDSPLLGLANVVFTPHLGASTREAQTAVGVQIAQNVASFLANGEPIHAINLPSVSAEELASLRPFGVLGRRMGRLLETLAGGPLAKLGVTLAGGPDEVRPSQIATEVLVGLLAPRFDVPVNRVNAGHLAQEHGITVTSTRSDQASDYKTLLTVEADGPSGPITLAGTIFDDQTPRLVRIGALEIEAVLEGPLALTLHADRPGVVAAVGGVLAEARRNIKRMHIGPVGDGGMAMAMIGLDEPIDASVLEALAAVDAVQTVHFVDLRGV